jgi:hypothetical protein
MTGKNRTAGTAQEDHRRIHDLGLLSGYLDGELTQAEAQFVEVCLESSENLRRELAELKSLREAIMDMEFAEPTAEQWDEHARGIFSSGARGLGWVMLIIWTACLLFYGAWQFFSSGEDLLMKLMVFGLCFGLGLLFVSVLVERLKSYGRDKYRRVIR